MKFMTERHKKLMRTSETALHDAATAPLEDVARVARTVISDGRTYRSWETRHAELMLPAARSADDRRLLAEMRSAQLSLVPRRALFNYLKEHQVVGEKRIKVFRLFHGTLDFNDSVLLEHRNFLLAESSQISATHILAIMRDGSGNALIDQYEQAYAKYFSLKCERMITRSRTCAEMIRPLLAAAHNRLDRVRMRVELEVPQAHGSSFDRVEALEHSGRFRALDYLNR